MKTSSCFLSNSHLWDETEKRSLVQNSAVRTQVGLLQRALNQLLRQVLNVFHVISNVLFIRLVFFLYTALVIIVNSLENYCISVWCYLFHHHLFCANIMTLRGNAFILRFCFSGHTFLDSR